MPRRKVPLSQLEIPVPSQPAGLLSKATLTSDDKDTLYGRHMGPAALLRQQEQRRVNTTCSCTKGWEEFPDKRTGKTFRRFVVNWRLHEVGCKYIPLRFV